MSAPASARRTVGPRSPPLESVPSGWRCAMKVANPLLASDRPSRSGLRAGRAAVLVVALTSLAIAGAQVRVVERDLRVDIEPASRTVRVAVSLRTAGVGRLDLRLSPLAQGVEWAAGGGWIAADGGPLSFADLPDGATVELRYRLRVPPEAEGIALRLGPDDGHLLPESGWFPVAADAWLAPPTPYRLTVRVPAGLVAVGAGTLASAADGTTTIASERPGLPFVAYGRLQRIERDGVDLWLTADLTAYATRLGDLLAPELDAILRTYHAWFAPPCPAVRLVSVARRGGWGAPCTLLLEEPAFARVAAGTALDVDTFAFLAHELAHTWWGNGVSPELPAYGLLVEGTAEYLSALAVEERHGTQAAERLWRAWQEAAVADLALDRLTPYQPEAYGLAYAKGAWVHRMLEGWMGRDAYLAALARLARDDPRPSLANYRAALEAAGGVSLAAFFDEWVHGTAYPHYRLEGGPGAWTLHNDGTAGTPPVPMALDGTLRHVPVPPGGQVALAAERVVVDPRYHVLQAAGAPPSDDAIAAESAMGCFLAALATRDGTRLRDAFTRPGPAVERLAELAADVRVDDWTLDGVAVDGDGRVFTFMVVARLGDQRIGGPLELAVDHDGTLVDIPRVSLRTR